MAAEGFVRLEQREGVWWFINAQGKPFVSLGINHAGAYVFFAPYNKQATIERYGADGDVRYFL
jgi:hypothetical protein